MTSRETKISVITVCKNAGVKIEQTLLSVSAQSYSNLEHIIVDGASTDETVSIIRKYVRSDDKWVSSEDVGIYDAMNKGVEMASGDYVCFLGAGDSFSSTEIVSRVARKLAESPQVDILCGKVISVDGQLGLFRPAGRPLREADIFSGCMHPHQGMLTRRQLLLDHPFSTEYRIAADFAFFLLCHLKKYHIAYINDCIALFDCDGVSSTSGKWISEYEQILIRNLPEMKCLWQPRLRMERIKRIVMKIASAVGLLKAIKVYLCGWSENIPTCKRYNDESEAQG